MFVCLSVCLYVTLASAGYIRGNVYLVVSTAAVCLMHTARAETRGEHDGAGIPGKHDGAGISGKQRATSGDTSHFSF